MLVCLVLATSTGCLLGPNHRRPDAAVPAAFRERPANWAEAQPSDALARGAWWEVFADPALNDLESRLSVSNQTLKAAEARLARARAVARGDESDLWPTISAGPSAERTRTSGNAPAAKAHEPTTRNDFVLPLDATYEADLWGRIRRGVEASRASAEATAADLEAARLSLHAELAVDYFQLRSLDAETALLRSTVTAFEDALHLTERRHAGGLASGVDVAQARTQLESTRAQAIDLEAARARFEHAIATLVGTPASDLSLAVNALTTNPPAVPVGVPSELLERRPDVAAAERRVAAANASIGVAEAAYYPTVSLTARGGYESVAISRLVDGPSALWAIGAQSMETIFDGGRRRAATEEARAAHAEAVANYRQTVLGAFEEVENGLATLRTLEAETVAQDAAVAASEQSLDLALRRYKGGIVTYLEVANAQRIALENERTAVSLRRQRYVATVPLIKALGGGWQSSIPAIRASAP